MKHKPRRVPTKAELAARLQSSLRRTLTRQQITELGLAHVTNLGLISKGEADESVLWQWVGGILTWMRVAQLLGLGEPEMNAQAELGARVLQRYGRTGRVLFTGPDYQLAKDGVEVMDQLAEAVDPRTASAAADWSEALVNSLAASCTYALPSIKTATEEATA